MKLKHTPKYGAALLAVCVGMAASSGVAYAKKEFKHTGAQVNEKG
jgi:hypothetical protein